MVKLLSTSHWIAVKPPPDMYTWKFLDDQVQDKFPQFTYKILNGGLNIYVNKGRIITVYWSKNKWLDNKTGNWQQFKAVECLPELFEILEGISAPKNVKEIKTDGGVQACIDHINNKAEFIGKSNYQLATTLKAIANELQQYL